MGYVLSIGTHKGGVGKSSTTSTLAWLFARQGKKVLVCDYDPQGNATFILTQRNIYDFADHTIFEAIKEQNARPYIQKLTENLHILTAEDLLALLPRWLYTEYAKTHHDLLLVLKNILDPIKSEYDWILIDLPPQLGDITITGIAASDFAVPLLESSVLCYDALDRYLETLEHVQDRVPTLRLLGIVPTMVDSRATLDASVIERARSDYGDAVFDTVIKRRVRVKEWTVTGIKDDAREDREALQMYENLLEEVVARVRQKEPVG